MPNHLHDDGKPNDPSRNLSRRTFLKYSSGALLLGAAAPIVSACGGSSAAQTRSSSPTRGGTLRVGYTGGTSSDTLDGQAVVNNVDIARALCLYDGLVVLDLNAQAALSLAESIEPNKTATEWTIRLRPGITFHNGKPLTADDVIFSFQRIVTKHLDAENSLARCNVKGMQKLDNLTVRIPCAPFSTFLESLATNYTLLPILPVGFNPKLPVGTGPFKFESFQPGVESVFTRNDSYWQHPYPYLDRLIITDYSDETSQVNALLAGQVDCINSLTPTSIAAVESGGGKVVISESGSMLPFTMRCDTTPFTDVNLRQGLRYVVDRAEMLKAVYNGHGRIGNDLFSPFDPVYDASIPQREQDLDRAKYYFKQAGVLGKTLTMQTANIAGGAESAAQVLAQQASAAGLNIALDTITTTEFYGPNYTKWTFAQDYWFYEYYLIQVSASTIPTAPYDETHFSVPRYTQLYNEAISTIDATQRAEICHEMQMIDWTQGGNIIPFFPPVIDGYGSKVSGALPSKTGVSFSNDGFARFWLA